MGTLNYEANKDTELPDQTVRKYQSKYCGKDWLDVQNNGGNEKFQVNMKKAVLQLIKMSSDIFITSELEGGRQNQANLFYFSS